MKDKHVKARLEQCLALAKRSPCPRRRYGALAIDPVHNVVISEGWNGGPRGGSALCGGVFCARDGLKVEELRVLRFSWPQTQVVVQGVGDKQLVLEAFGRESERDDDDLKRETCERYPPIPSGTRYEIGCHHAEANVVCNAARVGRSLFGAWLFVTGMPCLGCAKLIHHAGVAVVVTVRGGYAGENGSGYLRKHGVEVHEVDPPDNAPLDQAVIDPGGR